MSRYVKADMIGCPCGYCEGYDECQKEVDEAPSIDIVRCGECKYWHKNRKEGDGMNVFDVCYDFQADDFCSYGDRKDEQTERSE